MGHHACSVESWLSIEEYIVTFLKLSFCYGAGCEKLLYFFKIIKFIEVDKVWVAAIELWLYEEFDLSSFAVINDFIEVILVDLLRYGDILRNSFGDS